MHSSGNNTKMAFKSIKQKLYYHRTTPSTFFDSSYQQHLRQSHGLINLDTSNPSNNFNLQPNPVIVATIDDGLLDDSKTNYQLHSNNSNSSVIPNQFGNSSATTNNGVTTTTLNRRNSFDVNSGFINNDHYKISKKFYSTESAPPPPPSQQQQTSTTAKTLSNERYEKEIFDETNPWEIDTEESLNGSTYLMTHIKEINKCYESKDYDKINSLYQSLKRNNLVPPLTTYEMILDSFNKRLFDSNNQNLNEKMFQLLNCYQDIINNKLKPTTKIYNLILLQIFKNSIIAFESNNSNGFDFFKIGSELFLTIIKNNQLNNDTINYYLLAMNLYGMNQSVKSTTSIKIPDLDFIQSQIINMSPSYEKDSFYFISLINLSKLKNDSNFTKQIYNEFLLSLKLNSNVRNSLNENQFEIYSMFISTLIECGELPVATKIFDNVINEIKVKNGMSKEVTLVISNFLLSLSKIDSHKAYELWSKFNKLKWVPEFQYDFYLLFMANCFHDWELTKKIYDFIFPMKRAFNENRLNSNTNLSSYLLYPINTQNIINSLLDYALQLKDNDIILKLIEESIIKKFNFDICLYPHIFSYLKEINCPTDYLLRFISSHSKDLSSLEFLNSITTFNKDTNFILELTKLPFFKKICQTISFDKNTQDLSGLIISLNAMWGSPKLVNNYPYLLELHASLLIKIYDFDSFIESNSEDAFTLFRSNLVDRFNKLAQNYQRLNLDPNNVNGVVAQAIKLTDLPAELINYFNHPGDWDKSYPLSFGSIIRNSTKTGIKEFENLSEQGYSFDYDTYKELIRHRYINKEVVTKCYEFHNDDMELKFLTNLLVSKLKSKELEPFLINNLTFFQSRIMPHLNDASLVKFIKNLNHITLCDFLAAINFPENFKSIATQVEFKNSIKLIYEKLYLEKGFTQILKFNEIFPVLNLEILLKSSIRSGQYELFKTLFDKYKNKLNEAKVIEIKSEYLINIGEFDHALEIIERIEVKDSKLNDLHSFVIFLKSFSKCNADEANILNQPENSLQLANTLTTFSNFSTLVSYYDNIIVSYNDKKFNLPTLNKGLANQMLNNLLDATELLDFNSNGIEQSVMKQKLKTYFRFRTFLKLPVFDTTDIQKLIKIWSFTKPFAIDSLYNNIVESLYLNPNSIVSNLNINSDISWNFDKDSLVTIINDIQEIYSRFNQTDKIKRLSEFKSNIISRLNSQEELANIVA